MATLRGYKPLGGTSRQYRAPGGKVISRREYDNRRAQAVGFKNRYELEQFRTRVVARGKWADWQYDVRQRTGRMPTFQDYADVREVRQRRTRLRKRYPNLQGSELDKMDKKLVDKDGPLARILDHSGRRPKSSFGGHDVGDSP